MKVVAFNGSPKKHGNTYMLLKMIQSELRNQDIDVEIVHIGGKKVIDCIACNKCFDRKDKRCILNSDFVNDAIEKMVEADGIIIGSPTYFADVSSDTKALIDRAGLVGIANDGMFSKKVGAAVVTARRGGYIHAYDTINHFFGMSNMITVGSSDWNVALGEEIGDVEKDEEGLKGIKNLAENMAWLLKKIHAGEEKA
ncbi:multimeric flavodoxin WrbA [Methanomicrobium sp. W14]|uniref:flavodoxin family protein n=1 Tax=Methanomicrobium sp. W14 TaxID=2817839 RepID=UPI001AE6E0FB|nr:flavodoxin family protein [Methanomicrobium sp. W14]MBP2133550.1 multimeric flavodoxin WrbA [Methanomicrobium sp. W14]